MAAAAGPAAAPELTFRVEDGGRLEHAAAPALRFGLRIESSGEVRSVGLAVQIRIAATRRSYDERAQRRLVELFGRPEDWSRNLHGLLWTSMTVQVPSFSGATTVDLHVPCTYDLEVAAARYLNALEDGDVPLEFLFSGTVFYPGAGGQLQAGLIGWDKEAGFRLPVAAWRETMDHHFPGGAWLRLRRESFDRLCAYKARHTLMSWDDVVARLLEHGDD
jgi:hypothetical protein